MTTKIEFYDRVVRSLSGGLVDVELEEEDLDVAFQLAKQTYTKIGNANEERDFYSLTVTKGVHTYNLTEEGILSISNIIRPKRGGLTSYEDPFVQSAYELMFNYNAYGSSQMFILYDLTMQMEENIRQYTVAESEWIHNKRQNTLRFLKAPTADGIYVLDCYHTPTDEQLYDNLWVFKYTLAEAKCILGRAYRKFGTLPSPTGESQIDGNDLVTEGKDEKNQLEESVMDFQYGEADGLGVYIG